MAKDKIHDAVKNALINDGWKIIADPLHIEYEELEIFVDLAAERLPITAERADQKIVVEIKTFAGRSFIRDLQQAIGQCGLYSDLIELTGLDYELYLAISEFVYQDSFTKKGTRTIIQRHKLKLLVVDIEQEEVVKWVK